MIDKPELTAIDVLLNPDEALVKKAFEVNERLIHEFSKGFKLDESHVPHISILQRYVRTKDLDKVFDAVKNVISSENVASFQLTAVKIECIASEGSLGLAAIVISPTKDLLNFQSKLIDALKPYIEKNGTSTAYYVTPEEDPNINEATLEYVENYIPDHSGKNFVPHVTVGVNTIESLEKISNEPFTPLKSSPVNIAVYHLGNYGTARKVLKEWNLSQVNRKHG
jgi:2'-5' RNA ligase